MNSVSGKIDAGQGTISALVNDTQLYSNLAQSTSTLQSTMTQAQTGVTDFQENMEALKHNFILSGYFKKRGYEDEAELAANGISALPQGAPVKTFTIPAKQLFDGRDSAKLKNQKSLDAGGEFLAANQFGVAVVVVSAGAEGDSAKDLTLSQARAMVVREYLVENYGFDDSHLKTLGLGKQTGGSADAEGGSIQILVFPPGTDVPPDSKLPAAVPAGVASSQPVNVGPAATQKP